LVLLMRPALSSVSNRTLPVSRSLSRTRQGCSASGSTTRQPSLKSNRMPLGPFWVGRSATVGATPSTEAGAAAGSGTLAASGAGAADMPGAPAGGAAIDIEIPVVRASPPVA
jgi:hypothetical protein